MYRQMFRVKCGIELLRIGLSAILDTAGEFISRPPVELSAERMASVWFWPWVPPAATLPPSESSGRWHSCEWGCRHMLWNPRTVMDYERGDHCASTPENSPAVSRVMASHKAIIVTARLDLPKTLFLQSDASRFAIPRIRSDSSLPEYVLSDFLVSRLGYF